MSTRKPVGAGGGSPPGDWAVKELLATYSDCGIDPEVWPRDSLAIAAKLFLDLSECHADTPDRYLG